MADPRVAGIEYVHLDRAPKSLLEKVWVAVNLKLGRYESCYWSDKSVQRAVTILKQVHVDAIVANDLETLPLALSIANGKPVVLDAHEYSPREYEEKWWWKFFLQKHKEYLCRQYLPASTGMLTVCDGIAEEYKNQFGVDPVVMFNSPAYAELSPCKTQSDVVRLIHHGGAQPGRQIELMIELMDYLDNRFQLDLMLLPSVPKYLDRLKSLAATRPRLRILPPVPKEKLLETLNEYDIGVYLLPPNSFNNEHALPNKFFDFIQARLAVAIGPSPEMARLVRQYGCGTISEEFSPHALAKRLNALSSNDIDRLKEASNSAANELCFEKTASVLLNSIERACTKDRLI